MSEYERACVLSTSTIERVEMSSRKRPKSDMPSLDDLLAQGSRARESSAAFCGQPAGISRVNSGRPGEEATGLCQWREQVCVACGEIYLRYRIKDLPNDE